MFGAVLPEGSTIPPLANLLLLAVGVLVVGGLLWRERPAVTEAVVVALAPWMVFGAALHVLFQLGLVPAAVAPLLGTPSVYLTTAVLAGAVWLLARRFSNAPERWLGGTGTALAVVAAAATLALGGVVRVAVPFGALVVGVALGLLVWWLLGRFRPEAVSTTGYVGLLVVVAHAVDGVTTAVGVDVLGFGERSPLSAAIMHAAGALPTASVLGVGWLFVLVKVAVAAAVVLLFAEYVREEPTVAFALLGLIAAVGLGPGANNLLLYALAGP